MVDNFYCCSGINIGEINQKIEELGGLSFERLYGDAAEEKETASLYIVPYSVYGAQLTSETCKNKFFKNCDVYVFNTNPNRAGELYLKTIFQDCLFEDSKIYVYGHGGFKNCVLRNTKIANFNEMWDFNHLDNVINEGLLHLKEHNGWTQDVSAFFEYTQIVTPSSSNDYQSGLSFNYCKIELTKEEITVGNETCPQAWFPIGINNTSRLKNVGSAYNTLFFSSVSLSGVSFGALNELLNGEGSAQLGWKQTRYLIKNTVIPYGFTFNFTLSDNYVTGMTLRDCVAGDFVNPGNSTRTNIDAALIALTYTP